MRTIVRSFALMLFLFISAVPAQDAVPVTIALPAAPPTVAAGESFRTVLTVTIVKPWHINSHQPHDEILIPSRVSVAGKGFGATTVQYPEPRDLMFGFSDQPVSVFDGVIEIPLIIKSALTLSPGKHPLTVTFEYQACNDITCLAPTKVTAAMTVDVTPGNADIAVTPAPSPDPSAAADSTIDETAPVLEQYAGAPEKKDTLTATLEENGLGVALLFIFLGGLALNLTPCVYPLIPITIGYFGGQSEGKTSRLFLLGLLYMLGMALTYSVIGVATSLSGALFGALLQNVYVIIGIAALFVVLALSQFGVYEFNLPGSWMAAAGGARGGAFGAFFMGLTMGVVAAPCIGPFVIGLVTVVAAAGDPLLGFLMFFVLAVGLGLPYLFLALFSGKIKSLPRSGEWMEGVKHVFGFVMLGMALYFLGPVLPAPFDTASLPVFGIAASLILLLADRTGNGVKGFRTVKTVLSLLVIGVSVYALVPEEKRAPDWRPFTEAAYDASLAAKEPMIVDFYADWCIPCKELDAMTFSDRRVIAASKRFTMYKADLTRSGEPETEALTKRFAIKGVPTVLIIGADGREHARITGFVDAAEFLRAMDDAVAP